MSVQLLLVNNVDGGISLVDDYDDDGCDQNDCALPPYTLLCQDGRGIAVQS